jgi:hypothetical protein
MLTEERTKFIENFFICSMIDLQNRMDGNIYDTIRASGILRQLLMDSSPLLSQANQRHKLKIVFELRDNSSELSKNHEQLWVRPIPVHDNDPVIKLDKEKFLQYPICIYKHHTYRIRDLIDYFCHILGGIHSGKPREEKEETFTKIHKAFFPIIQEWPSISMKFIIQIVIKGLTPLINEIQNNRHTPTGGD